MHNNDTRLLNLLVQRKFINLRYLVFFVVVQLLSHVLLFATPWTAARQASLSFTSHLPELAQTHVHQIRDAIQPSHPLSSPSPAFSLS